MKLKRIERLLKEASMDSVVECFCTVGHEDDNTYRVKLHFRWENKDIVIGLGAFKPADVFHWPLQKYIDKLFYGNVVRALMGLGAEGIPSIGMMLYRPHKYFDKLLKYY